MTADPEELARRHLGVAEATIVDTYKHTLKRAAHRVRTENSDVAVLQGGVAFDRKRYGEPVAMNAAINAGYDKTAPLLAYDLDEEVLITRHVPGELLSDADTTGEHDARLHGQLLADLHTTTADAFEDYGYFTEDGLTETVRSWPAMYRAIQTMHLSFHKDTDHTDKISSAIQDVPFEPNRPIALTHGDAEPHNIILPERDIPPVLIDFQAAAVLDPVFEAARRGLVTATRYHVDDDYDIDWRTYHDIFNSAYANHTPWDMANTDTYERTLLYYFAAETDSDITRRALQRLNLSNTTTVIADTLIERLYERRSEQ